MVDENNALSAPSSGGKMTKGGKRGGKTAKVNPPSQESKKAQTAVDREVAAVRDEIEGYRDRHVEAASQEIVDIVADTPVLVVKRVADLLSDYEGDPTFFRGIGRSIGETIFGSSSTDAA